MCSFFNFLSEKLTSLGIEHKLILFSDDFIHEYLDEGSPVEHTAIYIKNLGCIDGTSILSIRKYKEMFRHHKIFNINLED